MKIPTGSEDPKIMALPHPKRIELAGIAENDKLLSQIPTFKMATDPSICFHKVVYASRDDKVFNDFMFAQMGLTESERVGSLMGELISMRHRWGHGAMFQTTDALETLLHETDIPDDIPCSVFRPPLPLCFIEFGETRQSPLIVDNDHSGEHILEGAYIIECHTKAAQGESVPDWLDGHYEPGQDIRVLHMSIVGSPLGKENSIDDATRTLSLYIVDEDEPVLETLRRSCDVEESLSDEEMQHFWDSLRHVIKVCLYLGSREARTRSEQPFSEAMKRMSGLGPKKQAKAKRKLDKLYDRIVVGPEHMARAQEMSANGTGRSVRPHWRRGHFRRVAVGKGRSERRLTFISPVLVRADRLSGEAEPAPGKYTIR